MDSFVGEVYFRVSKHLGIVISEVIRGFYNHDWDIIMLMRKYGEEIKAEQKRIKKMEAEARKVKQKSKRMRK
ncbi:hypothetical protein [Methanobrevibacter sp.]|uniref:hypothetical protein n=1 Tax=Methanobrevibacter sp. TaxID=66852 RepID=UPI0025D9DB5D|nr:hypothetical protein [Methanobrevibacter sp.]MBQ6511761.1 hypothetical protein [Methanobrevibacter sp.]MBQ6513033.1 hypothetical protein [Methanobrevibacter sp.]